MINRSALAALQVGALPVTVALLGQQLLAALVVNATAATLLNGLVTCVVCVLQRARGGLVLTLLGRGPRQCDAELGMRT